MLNYRRLLKINGKKILLIVKEGKISIAGNPPLDHILMYKEHNNYNYKSQHSGKKIMKYKNLSPRDFLLKLIEERVVII